MTSSLGGTSFLPGSHRTFAGSVGSDETMVTLAPPLGTWLAVDSRVLHRGEANVETWQGIHPPAGKIEAFFMDF
jgi:hypothetical protein